MKKPIKGIWVVLWLVLFFPVGLYLLWARADWDKNVKWIITAALAVLVLLTAFGNKPSSSNSMPAKTVSSQSSNTPIPTVTPTVDPEKQAISQYASQIGTLDQQVLNQNNVVEQDATAIQGNSITLDKFRTDAVTAETTFKGVQQELNVMHVPAEMTDTHSHFTTAVTLYIQGLDEVIKGIDDNDTSEITAGAGTYAQGTQELTKATDAAKAYINSQ